MKKFKQSILVFLVMALFGVGYSISAQTHKNGKNVEYIIKRLETNTDEFRSNLDVEYVNARNEERRESLIHARVAAFEFVTDRLYDRIKDNEVIPADIEDVLSRGLAIEHELRDAKISTMARADWMRVKGNLDNLAKAYNVTWVWTLDANPYWKSPAAAERIVDRLEDSTDEFRRSFDYAIDKSSFDGTKIEDNALRAADQFEDQIDRWEDLADKERLSEANVRLLLKRGLELDAFMRANNLTSTRAWRDWTQVKANLNELAMMANIDWQWNASPVIAN